MSIATGKSGAASNETTTVVTGSNVLQAQDFYIKAGLLHPIVIGSIAVCVLFTYLRIGSNRSVAPITVFDWIINVALGSTLAGIVNGTSLVRGLLALATMLAFQFITSHVASNYKQRLNWVFSGPPLLVCFRGEMLHKVMEHHRISSGDINGALRAHGLLNISLVECMIIEPNGAFSVFETSKLQETDVQPDTLLAVPAYSKLCEESREKRPESV